MGVPAAVGSALNPHCPDPAQQFSQDWSDDFLEIFFLISYPLFAHLASLFAFVSRAQELRALMYAAQNPLGFSCVGTTPFSSYRTTTSSCLYRTTTHGLGLWEGCLRSFIAWGNTVGFNNFLRITERSKDPKSLGARVTGRGGCQDQAEHNAPTGLKRKRK